MNDGAIKQQAEYRNFWKKNQWQLQVALQPVGEEKVMNLQGNDFVA